MKEFDYSKWDNKPREMWVWNDNENEKKKRFVVLVRSNRVLSVHDDDLVGWWEHCAEIGQSRRMTNYELAHWLWEGTQVGEFREYKMGIGCFTEFEYDFDDEDRTVDEDIKIRVNGGEWKEPLIEE